MLTSKITRLVGSNGSLVCSKAVRAAGSAGGLAQAPSASSSARAAEAMVAGAAILVLCLRRIGPHATIPAKVDTGPQALLARAPQATETDPSIVQPVQLVCLEFPLRSADRPTPREAPVAVMLGAGALLAGLAAGLGAIYLLAVWLAVRRFGRRPTGAGLGQRPSVTILKPLHGEDPELYANLRSFCEQAYPAVQIVFGVRDAGDPAVAVVRRLIADLPGADLDLVIDPRVHGTNLKISNLINMMTVARHPFLVIADSDMRVLPCYLDALVGDLAEPGVVLVAGLIRPWPGCFGATMALHRETLRQIGGFARFRDQLADDYRHGAAVVE